jgi:RHS repeat-associated protein
MGDATNRRIRSTTTEDSWWSTPSSARSTSYTANNLNQYSAVGSVTPTYDGNGNLTYDGSFTYCYDAESRLTGIVTGTCASPTTTIATYAYDAQGRRKSKTVSGATTIYVTDADNREVLEYNGSTGAVEAWYPYGLGLDEPLNRVDMTGSSRQTLIPDVQGSIIGALDSSGTLTKNGYQTYGENPSLASGNYQYTSRRFDAETAGSVSSGLYYYCVRMYSPTWGRFLQAAPIGYAGGANLVAYVNN